MKKILLVFGTRPEAIKMAPVYLELKKEGEVFETAICVTAQHREMLDQVLDFFSIVPEYDLNLMKANQSLIQIQSAVMLGLKPIFEEFKPNLVLVHGDTTTSMAASLAAFYERIPVGHVEAGLRTFNKYSPYPEEINRQITSRLASLHFAPTFLAFDHLIQEKISPEDILVTGNTVIDALLRGIEIINSKPLATSGEIIDRLHIQKKIILVTAHRRENFGQAFENMCQAMLEISERDDVQLVFPVHMNPQVREVVNRTLSGRQNVLLIEPQSYAVFLLLMQRSFFILTDSGGIQEEAPSLSKPVVVMRDTTERPEGVESGFVKLVGTAKEAIVREATRLLDEPAYYEHSVSGASPFGDGKASERICIFIKEKLE